MKQLGDIAGVFAYLSLLTVGGGMAAFPELKVLRTAADYVFVLATAAAVAGFGVQVPYALVVAGAVAIWWHRPRNRQGSK